ncbi:MAG: hypothetical protein A3D90_02960, partial [Sulfuricurvum sp. RIFCSPHIGHO2_02_FULL_43_9]
AGRGSLDGVPIGIKDIYNTEHFPTEMGSVIWKGFTPGNDARSVFSLKEQGAIVVGKTVTAEFAVHYPGPTVNPHDHRRTPGTSSSGSAAAVAASMVPIATGSQTAGSTIRPASYCGIYGFKPTFGLIPRTGVLKTVDTLDHVTVFARSIEDIELAFEIMRVKGPDYPFANQQVDNARKQPNMPWKIAFLKTHLWGKWEKYAQDAILDYVKKISVISGISIEETEIPPELQDAHSIHNVIYNKGLSYYYKEEYENHKDKLSEVFRKMLEDGQKMSRQQYVAALEKRHALVKILDKFLHQYDGIITLSTAGEAKIGLDSVDTIDSCLIWTLCEAPSINLPVFTGPNRMPFGAQVVFRKYNDKMLFRFLELLKAKQYIHDVCGDLRPYNTSENI